MISILGNEENIVHLEDAALTIVIFDLLIALTLWFSMVMLKPILIVTDLEIDMNTVTAEDFSVMIKCP
jgi:hypothetical protein